MTAVSNYRQSKQQLTELSKERSAQRAVIQQSFTTVQTQKFEQSQATITKEWSNSSDHYRVTINGQDLVMDRDTIFVSDNAKVLTKETKKKIDFMNQEFAQFNEGQQLMVVTIQKLPRGQSIESFANAVLNQLGIGQAEQNNGLLYVMAIDNHKTRIEVGYGLEETVTDAKAGSILDDEKTVADFKDKAYDQGVNRILDQLYTAIGSLTPEYDLQIKTAQEQEKQAKIFLWVCSMLIIFCVISSGIFLLQTQKVKLDYAAYQSANSSGSSSGSSFGGGGASGGW